MYLDILGRLVYRTYQVWMLILINFGALLCFQACELLSFSSQERSISDTFDDTSMRLKISQSLLLHDSGALDSVEVLVYQKKVLLVGNVSSNALKTEAEKIVRNIKEVTKVWNELQVGEESFSDYLSDSLSEKKIKADLLIDGEIHIENYMLRVFKDVLYVVGSASSPEELKRLKYHVDQFSLRDAKYFVEPRKGKDIKKCKMR